MTQVIICFTDELFCIEESIHEETAARNLSGHPAVEACIKFALRHLGTFHPAKSRPVVDPEVRNTRQKHFNHTSTKVVRHQEIWVDQVKLVDEVFEHLLLSLEDLYVRVPFLFDFLRQVKGQWLLV